MKPDGKRRAKLLLNLAHQVRPVHTALLVVDLQNDFCASGGYIGRLLHRDLSGCRRVASTVMNLVEIARRAGTLIVWAKAIYDRRFLADPALAKQRQMGIDTVCCKSGSWGADFYLVKPAASDPIIEKHRYSAFFGTDLNSILRSRDIRTLIVTGVQTNVCVDSTVRDGHALGYYIVVPSDCVASHTLSLHIATLRNIDLAFGTVTTSGQLADLWNVHKSRRRGREFRAREVA